MGGKVDVIVFVAGGAEAVGSLGAGSAGGGPVGAAGQVISTAGAGAQAIGSISGITAIATVGTGIGGAGAVLTAYQIKVDLAAGQSIKAGDALSVGVGIPVAVAVGTGAIASGSILIPVAAVAAFIAAALNIGGVLLDDLFKFFDKFSSNDENPSRFPPLPIDFWRIPGYKSVLDPICYRDFNSGLNWTQPRDPLVLDLDGDGIELTASNSAVLFDHNADTIKTGSQWVKSDDALLVRDINGNGSIDSGRELFGDQTQLANGPLAANGFAALADLDRDANGLSDGVFNAHDTAYSSLRIWRDLNQDGISQDGELQTLAQAGISAINLTANAQGTNALMGSFTRTVTSTDAAGMVRGLREAMSLKTVQAGGLEGLVSNYHYRNNSKLLNIHVGKVAEKLVKADKCRWRRVATVCVCGYRRFTGMGASNIALKDSPVL